MLYAVALILEGIQYSFLLLASLVKPFMKKCFLLITTLLCLFNKAYATENDWQISLLNENMDMGDATSIRLHTGYFLYGGVSLNYIHSSTVIQDSDRRTIYPLMFFMGLKAPSKVTPFVEAGVDLPEVLFDEMFDNEENSIDLTDYYLASGLEIALSKELSLSFFAKKYVFKYQGATLNITNKVRTDSYGIGLTMHF